MPKVRDFMVLPALPEALKDLELIAQNMFWTWNCEYVELFRRIDNNLWNACEHNPVKMLSSVSQRRLEQLAENKAFLSELRRNAEKLKNYLQRPTWFEKVCLKENTQPIIAYFSAEYGIHECLPIYAGGLGGLAGDHLKSASDLGVPIIAIGLLYQKGYFRQYLNIDGWQQEHYQENEFYSMPMELVRKDSGRPLVIGVDFPGRTIYAQVWLVSVGKVKLYLMDTNVSANSPVDRMITSNLYGGDVELRIRQEIILGIGGMKALEALNIKPTVCHMNEGHAAFLSLERIRQLRSTTNMSFEEAVEATRAGNVFTIHTLVKAGLDEFRVDLMDKYFGNYFPNLGINRKQFLALGRIFADDDSESFKMPILAMRLSAFINGVSKLHGEVSREMWSMLWPGVPAAEVPVISITNGVHVKTWLAPEIESLFDRYLGSNWSEETFDTTVWNSVEQIPDEEFWRIHQQCKAQLIAFTRNQLKMQMQRRGTFHSELNQADEVLDLGTLTIGFARRFAGYKRGNLLLEDPKRLIKLLTDHERPMQIIFAGKSHPKDMQGKEIIRQIIHFANEHNVRRRLIFLEDYDINLARVLVQGVDVWLNNPRRPMEASGTSGMKAAVNGALNLSTLDGWWCEGYKPDGGWAVGSGETYEDPTYQNLVESQAIYNILENEVIPLFYTRSVDGIPRPWVRRVKNSIKWIAPRFSTHRMMAEYTRRFYNPADARWRYLTADTMNRAKSLSSWKSTIKRDWHEISIKDVQVQVNNNGSESEQLNLRQPQLKVGTLMNISALIRLGRINPSDVSVELYHGPIDAWGEIKKGAVTRMNYKSQGQDTEHWFCGELSCTEAGHCGVAVRIIPKNPDLVTPQEMGLILWENPSEKPATN